MPDVADRDKAVMTSSRPANPPSDPPVVAFDLMDTLLHDPFREALEAATGRPLSELVHLRDGNVYPAFERGEITEETYWAAYAAAGLEVDPDAFHEVRRRGYRWIDGMQTLLRELEGRARRVIASNYPVWIEELAATWLDGLSESVHGSCHLGCRKPDPSFYERLADALAVPPERVLFVDDREENVAAAREAGMTAVHFHGVQSVRDALTSWPPLRGAVTA